MPIEIVQIEVGLLQNFNVFVTDVATRATAIVDPAYEVDRLLKEAKTNDRRIEAVWLTHTHHDHVEGLDEIVRATGARVYVGRGERDAASRAAPSANLTPLDGDEVLTLGETSVTAIATPGHTLAGISYVVEGNVMTGDTLFIGGCGRSDFPGGDPRVLYRSLQKLAALPEETRVYPGHDYGATVTSTIGWETTTNPYLLCKTEDDFVMLRTGKSPHRPTRGPR